MLLTNVGFVAQLWLIQQEYSMINLLGAANTEATVVWIVCIFFLILFIVAGVRQIIKDKE